MSSDRRTSHLPARVIQAAAVAASLLTTGCGAIADRALETAVEEGIEAAVEADTGEDFELDLDTDDGSFEIQVGDAEGTYGGNLDRPDWLDENYELPPSLVMSTQTDHNNGSRQLGGIIEGETMADIGAQQLAAMESAGFVVEQFDAFGADNALASHPDGRAMEVLMFGEDGQVIFTGIFHEPASTGAGSVVSRIDALQAQAEDAG